MFNKLMVSLGILGVLGGCKPSQKAQTKVHAVQAFGQEDDGAIDVPKELEKKTALTSNPSLISRVRLSRENVSKDLIPGSKLSVKVRGVRALQLDIFAKQHSDKVTLDLEGSSLKTMDLTAAMSSLEIPSKSMGEELIEVLIPSGKDNGLQITQLTPKDGGEILSWKILSR